MTDAEYRATMKFLAGAIKQTLPQDTIDAWWTLFGKFAPEDFREAVENVVRTQEFPGLPPPGLVYRLAKEAEGRETDAEYHARIQAQREQEARLRANAIPPEEFRALQTRMHSLFKMPEE